MEFIREAERWNSLVKGFENWDIYYLYEHAHSMEIHGDGKPVLIYWEKDDVKLCYVMMEQDIAEFSGFYHQLEKGKYFDWTTPYGYGGPLISGQFTEEKRNKFLLELKEFCKENKIVSQFFRFHPFIEEQNLFFEMFEAKNYKDTVFIDLTDKDTILKNMEATIRNRIRKAGKNGVRIEYDSGERIEQFLEIYKSTMDRNQAEDYYYFQKQYFDYIGQALKENVIYFYALYEEKIISASIFFYNEKYMHYHLSGTLWQYKSLASMNLLFYEAALWGSARGIQKMHLGGGVEDNDTLFRFKRKFNRSGRLPFYIGRTIFDQETFDMLVNRREEVDESFDRDRTYMIKYRG